MPETNTQAPEVSAGRGWFGNMSQVKHYLRTVNADRDKDNSQPDGLCDQVGGAGARVVRGADW